MTHQLLGVLIATLCAGDVAGRAESCDRNFDANMVHFSPEVVYDAQDGAARLARSVLVADEMGATDFHQAEALGERVWAKKVLWLDSADVGSAQLFLFGGARQILVNGKPLDGSERLASTGWMRVAVPPRLLKPGENEIVLAEGGQLLLEPARQPARSFKSTDGGKTWSNQLGQKKDQQGEYLVRLRLGRFAPRGHVVTGVFRLWKTDQDGIARAGRLVAFQSLAKLNDGQPDGTRILAFLRTGISPSPDDKTWTDWTPVQKDYKPIGPADRHGWAQLKLELQTSRAQSTPRLPLSFLRVHFESEHETATAPGGIGVIRPGDASRPTSMSSPQFVYQGPSPRLKLLRERYQLDKVIAPGKTEMEQLMLLRHWVRNQWHTAWGSHPAAWMPPWDTHIILESKDQPDCLTMCTHYAAVFTQCCLALGWNARHCILDHHCVSEVFVNQHNKWVMMDAGNSKERADVGLHFERNQVPLSALELHLALRTAKTDGIMVSFTPARLAEQIAALCRPAPPAGKLSTRPDVVPLVELGNYPVCQLANYRRYAFPGRNNYLDSLYPGELYQGWSEYFYDGYWWVGDSPDDPQLSPEYSRHLTPSRPQDIDWSLNWTRAHLARTAKAGELQVDFETFTPNLARLERWMEAPDRPGQGSWQPVAPSFVWKLKPGTNTLRVRSVNLFDRSGVESSVQVESKPGT